MNTAMRMRRAGWPAWFLVVLLGLVLGGTAVAAPPEAPARLKGVQMNGQPLDLAQMRGHVVMVGFWATWCGVCAADMPQWQALYDALRGRGFDLVAVSIDDEEGPIRKRVAEKGFTFPVVWRFDDRMDDNFGDVAATPTIRVLDREGRVAFSASGRVPEAKLRAAVEALLR